MVMVRARQIGIRVEDDLVERIDTFAERERAARPGLTMSRADAINVLLNEALAAHGLPAGGGKATAATAPATKSKKGGEKK